MTSPLGGSYSDIAFGPVLQTDGMPIENGLVRATVFYPLKDAIGLPETTGLLAGDPEFEELADDPPLVGDRKGLTPIEISVFRVRVPDDPQAAALAAFTACRDSGLVAEGQWPSPPQASETSSAEIEVVVVAVTVIGRAESGLVHGDPIGRGLELVQRLQTAYQMALGGPAIEQLTWEGLPTLVPLVVAPGPPAAAGPGNMSSVFTRTFSAMSFDWPDLIDAEAVRLVFGLTGLLPMLPTQRYQEFRSDALIQLHRYGNYRQTIVAAATAIEGFLVQLLMLLLWEEGVATEGAAALLSNREGILTVVRREFPPRLHGSWNENRPGPVADWVANLVRVRNGVVHAGRVVHRTEALAGLRAVDGMVSFLMDRLASGHCRKTYPKTIVVLMPRPSLESRNAWTKKLEDASKEQLVLLAEFAQWMVEVEGLVTY